MYVCERKGEIGYNLMDWVIRMQYGNEFIYRREEWEVKDLIYIYIYIEDKAHFFSSFFPFFA